jgi:hypothetical protein
MAWDYDEYPWYWKYAKIRQNFDIILINDTEQERNSELFSLAWDGSEKNSESLPVFFSRNGIPSYFLFHGIVRKGILRVCLYFCATVWNSEHFSLPWNASERNSESFCSTEHPEFRRNKPLVSSIPSSA